MNPIDAFGNNVHVQPPPARVGMRLEEIDTPALLLDLEASERNLARLSRSLTGTGVRARPHAKSHKCPEIARRQVAHGAVGVCCQKVSEAEVLVNGGMNDVLVSNEVVGRSKLERLAALAQRARIGVCVDDAANIADVNDAARAHGVTLNVLVEINVGSNRCGTDAGAPAVTLARAVARCSHLRFAGLQAYHGAAQHLRTPLARAEAIGAAVEKVRHTVTLLKADGLPADVVTGAGTGTYMLEAGSGVYNEVQPGSYVFMDADYGRNLDSTGAPIKDFDHSLFILATVMSHPTATRAILDVGLKAHSVDSGMPLVHAIPGATYVKAADEHGVLELSDPARLALGQKIRLIPGHCDPTVNLHDWLVCLRADRVEAIWRIAGRGALC